MKLLWNSLLITLGILLPTSPLLAQSLKTSDASTSTTEVVSVADEVLPAPTPLEPTAPLPLESPIPVVAQDTSPTQQPETIVIPDVRENPTPTEAEPSSADVETIVIPDTPPQSTSTVEDTDASQIETTTSPTSDDGEEASSEETDAENAQTEDSTEEAEEAKEPELTPEELARRDKLIEADQLYMSGQFEAAAQLYREAKAPFEVETQAQAQAQAIHDPTQLPPAGAVYWRQSEQGLAQQLETKTLIPLQFLVEQFPEFIPGHLRYAQALKQYGREEDALQVLERASTLYPNEPELLKTKITALGEAERWLEASLTARRFALINVNHSQAAEFEQLAEENLERHRSYLRRKIRGNAIANIITGTLGYIVTGNLLGPISAIDTTILMLRGESSIGESVANRAKKQLPMLEDEDVLEYVREIGNKLAIVAGRDDFEYEFYVVMDDRLNAFALPGGKIFINAGAILKAKSEAELAGLIAHELAHAVLSHGFQLVTEGNLIANVTQYIPFGGTLTNLIVLDYSRDMEREADELGTRILTSSGYAADGLHNLMVTLAQQEDSDRPIFAWLSTHPDTNDRIRNLETLIQRNGYNRYTYEGVARHLAMQERVRTLLQEYKEREEREEE